MLVPWNGTENNIKVVILGESGVGKSSLAVRFVSETYFPYNDSTMGAEYLTKTMSMSMSSEAQECQCQQNIVSKKSSFKSKKCSKCSAGDPTVTFKIWDTSGQEKFHSLVPMYYRGAGAAILVFDLSKPESMDALRKWVYELKSKGPPDLILALCGNKSDLKEDRRIDPVTAGNFALEIGAFYTEVSAKLGVNVDLLFQEVARQAALMDSAAVSPGLCTCGGSTMTTFDLWEDILKSFNSSPGQGFC